LSHAQASYTLCSALIQLYALWGAERHLRQHHVGVLRTLRARSRSAHLLRHLVPAACSPHFSLAEAHAVRGACLLVAEIDGLHALGESNGSNDAVKASGGAGLLMQVALYPRDALALAVPKPQSRQRWSESRSSPL
jgi:hypothetical protein